MGEDVISAEITPVAPQHTKRVARALTQRGFRILHIGGSISVQAPRSVWAEAFDVAFAVRAKTVQPEVGRSVTYPHADPQSVRIPPELADVIADVAFAEPPDLH